MKTRISTLLLPVFFIFLFLTGTTFPQKDPGSLFEKALFYEESEGDLQKAISLYEKIIKDYSSEAVIAAKAQLHIGFCYEKLGKTEAIKAYELVVEKYTGQKEQVAAARARLDELRKESPKGLSVINLGGWEKPGMAFQPIEISADGKLGVGMEFMKGQNVITYKMDNKEVNYITNYTWDIENGYCYTYHPVLSPDGKEIAYFTSCLDREGAAGNSISVADLNGNSRVIASDTTDWFIPNAWLPDGSAILTIRGNETDGSQLGFYPKNGGDFKPLVSLKRKNQYVGRTYGTAGVSPDGKYILYTDTGPGDNDDIYIVGIDGSNPRPFASNPAAEKYPRWSPDGKNVVFLSMRHGGWALWGVNFKDGNTTGEPYLIRDGMKSSYLLNWSDYGLGSWDWVRVKDIYLMDFDPAENKPIGKPVQLEYSPTGNNGAPQWSPDGKSFAFVSANSSNEVSVVIVKENDFKKYPVPHFRMIGNMQWSPDGKEIGVIATGDSAEWYLHSLNAVSGVWNTLPIKYDQNWTYFEWGTNNNSILLSRAGFHKDGAGVYSLNLNTGEEKYIYSSQETDSAFLFRHVRRSRDNKHVAMLKSNGDVVVINLETGKINVAANGTGYPTWSPDGHKILTDGANEPEGSGQSLFVFPVEGGAIQRIDMSGYLPEKSVIRVPDWSPDGKKIVFVLMSNISEVLMFQNIIPVHK